MGTHKNNYNIYYDCNNGISFDKNKHDKLPNSSKYLIDINSANNSLRIMCA